MLFRTLRVLVFRLGGNGDRPVELFPDAMVAGSRQRGGGDGHHNLGSVRLSSVMVESRIGYASDSTGNE